MHFVDMSELGTDKKEEVGKKEREKKSEKRTHTRNGYSCDNV